MAPDLERFTIQLYNKISKTDECRSQGLYT